MADIEQKIADIKSGKADTSAPTLPSFTGAGAATNSNTIVIPLSESPPDVSMSPNLDVDMDDDGQNSLQAGAGTPTGDGLGDFNKVADADAIVVDAAERLNGQDLSASITE